MNSIIKNLHSQLESVYKVIDPKLDELVEKYRVQYKKETDKEPSDFAIECFRLGLVYDFQRSLYKHLEVNDKVHVLSHRYSAGSIVISLSVLRNETEYHLETSVIYAGGYNIQRYDLS